MATKTWLGNDAGNEGDLNVADNWSPTGVPIAADTVVFDDQGQAITASFTALAGVALTKIVVTDGANYAFGTAANFVELNGPVDLRSALVSGGIHQSNAAAQLYEISRMPTTKSKLQLSGAISIAGEGIAKGYLDLIQDPNFGTHARATSLAASAFIGSQATLESDANVTLNGGEVQGKLIVNTAPGSWRLSGTVDVNGSGDIAAMTIDGGTLNLRGSGNVTGVQTIRRGGRLRRFGDDTYTISGVVKVEGGSTFDPGSRATIDNPVELLTSGRPIILPAGATAAIVMPTPS